MATQKTTSSTVRKLDIPDMWLAGFCTRHNCSVADAVAWWMDQEDMYAQFQAQKAALDDTRRIQG